MLRRLLRNNRLPSSVTSPRAAPGEFQRQCKLGSRQKLLAAASEAFCASGYFAVSVDEISAAAGVSRMTFYRHFSSKTKLAAELFQRNADAAMPQLLAIAKSDFRDVDSVRTWIAGLFAADRASGALLRVFIQANADGSDFTIRAHAFIGELIAGLGREIPAFKPGTTEACSKRRLVEAWLLMYEILDQSNHAARDASVAADRLIIEILADRFINFLDRWPL